MRKMGKAAMLLIMGLAAMGCAMLAPTMVECEESVITEGQARFTVIAPECIRMEYSKDGKFIDNPSYFAVNRDASYEGHSVEKTDDGIIIDTGVIRLIYKKNGSPFNKENISAEIKMGDDVAIWKPGMANDGNLGGTIRTVDGVYGPVDLGEGFLSRDGWFLLDDSANVLLTEDWVMSRPDGSGLDWYLFGYGHDYKAALKAMVKIGGEIPMPRKYSLGVWYSRYWPYSSDDYRKIVKEYYDMDFPLDVMVLDMDWHKDGWTGWSWNRELLPDAEELMQWFHDKKLAVTLNVHPADGVGPHEDMYEAFMRDMGEDPASGKTLLYDVGNKNYLDTLFKHTHEDKEAAGVDFWWLDWQQYKFTRSIRDLTNLAWLNQYYTNHTRRDGKRGQSFSRWAGYGDHRHPIHFSGDANTGWPMLAFEIPFTSTAGNVGCFFWSHDIGGHMGQRIPESYTRWAQFGATTAALRSHSTRSPELDRRPWKYPKWAEESMRISFHLRSEIFPYIYSSAWHSTRDAVPLNIPMYFEYPDEEKAYHSPQQYFFGEDMLAAPIVIPGRGKGKVGIQTVWFPESDWYNWFTGEKYEAGSEAIVAADINEFPLYARAGTPIPMQPYTHRMASEELDELVIRCYPGKAGETGEFVMYEDDGESTKYEEGEFAETKLTCETNEDGVKVTIWPAKGSYEGQPEVRGYRVAVPATEKAVEVIASGKPVISEYDESSFTNSVLINARPIREKVEVEIKAKPADQSKVREKSALQRAEGIIGELPDEKSFNDVLVENAGGELDKNDWNALMAVAGMGMVTRNEGLYLYQKDIQARLFVRPGIMDDDEFDLVIEERRGDESEVIHESHEKVTEAGIFTLPQLPSFEVGEKVFGAPVKRIASLKFKVGGEPIVVEEKIDEEVHYLSKWQIIGTFEFDRNTDISKQNYGPQEEVDLDKTYEGVSGMGVRWKKAKTGDDGILDLRKYYYFDFRIAYAVTFIYSKEDQEADIDISVDDGFEAWINGEKVSVSANRSIGLVNESYNAKLPLKKGKNVFLVKVSQFWDDWMFRASIDAKKPIKESYN